MHLAKVRPLHYSKMMNNQPLRASHHIACTESSILQTQNSETLEKYRPSSFLRVYLATASETSYTNTKQKWHKYCLTPLLLLQNGHLPTPSNVMPATPRINVSSI